MDELHKANGEKKETMLLLSMWMKRKETWENTAQSLGEGCLKEENPEGKTFSVKELRDLFIERCRHRRKFVDLIKSITIRDWDILQHMQRTNFKLYKIIKYLRS